MPLPISKSQADRLGQRLAGPGPHSNDDIALLEQVLITYAGVVVAARQALDVLEDESFRNVSITGRAKTTLTTLEKLARNKSRLSSIEDLAGVRIVADITLSEQDAIVARVCDLFGGVACCKPIDRRIDPRSGYRAVHVVAKLDGLPVEVQVRTRCQDAWANAFERIADAVGRGIRYGEPADPTGNPRLDESIAGLVARAIVFSDTLYQAEVVSDEEPVGDPRRQPVDEMPLFLEDMAAFASQLKMRLQQPTDRAT